MRSAAKAFRFGSASTLVFAVALCAAQCEVTPLQGYAAGADGRPKTPKVGEPFYAAVRFEVRGTVNAPYRIRFQTAYATLTTSDLTFGVEGPGTYAAHWGPIPTLMDGPVTVTATLDVTKKLRGDNRRDNAFAFVVTPEPIASPVEFFDSKRTSSTMSIHVSWSSRGATPTAAVLWFPKPRTESFQEVFGEAAATPFVETRSEPFANAILSITYADPGRGQLFEQSATRTRASAVRVNRSLLALGRYEDYAFAPAEIAAWLQPETLVESDHGDVARFVASALPGDYRSSLSPVASAEALYRAVLARCSYLASNGQLPSALKTLRSRKGDCGGLSALFVAACRAAGIPARVVCGFGDGQDAWHVWAEFYDPRAGWIPVDPAYAEGDQPSGNLPIYFGVIPDLNRRVATSFGLDHFADGLSLKMLQSPAVFWFGQGVRKPGIDVSCSLDVID